MNVANGRLRRQSNTSSIQLSNLTARLADGNRKRSAPAPFGLKLASAPSSVTNARPVPRPSCLALHGVVAVLSGQDVPLKSHMYTLISSMGGRYARDLDPRTVTHLVVDSPTGNKYDYWRQHLRLSSGWAVDCHIVTSGWVDACDREGRRVDESEWGLGSENARKRRRVEVPIESRQRVETEAVGGRERLPEGLRRCSPLEICDTLIEENNTDRRLFSGRCFILVGFEGEILALKRDEEREGSKRGGRKGLNGGRKDSNSNLLEVEATRLDSSVNGHGEGGSGEFLPHFSSKYHPGSLKNSLATLLRRAGATILHRPNEFVDVVLVNDGISTEVYEDVREFCSCHPRGPLGATLDWVLGCLQEGRWTEPAFPGEPRFRYQQEQYQDEGFGDGGFDYYEGDETNQTDAAVLGVKEESNMSETTKRVNASRPRKSGPVSVEPNGPRREVKRETDAASKRGSKSRSKQQAQSRPGSSDLFRGSVFSIVRLSSVDDGSYNFDQSQIESTVTRHGGLLLDANLLRAVERDEKRRLRDPASSNGQKRRYFVVTTREFRVDMAMSASYPLLSSLSKLVEVETVSPVWVRACTEENQPFEPADCPSLFRPPKWSVRLLPADTFDRSRRLVVSVTGFVDSTRWAVKHALLLIGAEFTDTLTRRNTHLIAKEVGGEGGRSQKIVKADEWGINIVGVEWLHRVMRYGRDGANDIRDRFAINATGEGRVKEEVAVPSAKSVVGSNWKASSGDTVDRVRSSLEGGEVGVRERAATDSVTAKSGQTAVIRRAPPPVPVPTVKREQLQEGSDGGNDQAKAEERPMRARVSLFQSVMSSSQASSSGKKSRPPPANEKTARPANDHDKATCASASEATACRGRNGGETSATLEGARTDHKAASPLSSQNENSNSSWSSSHRRGKRDRSPRKQSPSSAVGRKAPQASPLRPAEEKRSPADKPGPSSSSSSLTPGPGSSPGKRLQFALDVLGGPPPAAAPADVPARRTRRGKRDRGRSPAPSQDSRGDSPSSGGSPADETQMTLGTVNVGAYAAGLGFARRSARAWGGRNRLIGDQMVPASQVDEAEDNGESQVIWFAGGR